MKTVEMPKWVAVCLAVSAIASLCFTALAITTYTLVKPYTLTITATECPLTVETIDFNYDPELNQYTYCTMEIFNSGATPITATVYVYLKNASQSIIAQGSSTNLTFNPGVSPSTVVLTWTQNNIVANVAGGYVVIQP